jgi:2-haloacid dehalogenase/putative hydrolase of the HAD superfamily
MRLGDFSVLTFDCYGTLIDWESGIWNAIAPVLDRSAVTARRDQLLEAFGRYESAQQSATPDMLYPELLAEVYRQVCRELGIEPADHEAQAFGASIRDWPAFPDSPEALAYLKQHYKLVILSNVDRESFRHSRVRLGVEFDAVFTAQDIGSYKPDPRNFQYMLDRLSERGIGKEQILHTAESLHHDHVPAQRFGLATCWIWRRHGQGATASGRPGADVETDFRFESLGAMADAHRAEVSRG